MKLERGFWKGKKVLITGHTGFKGSWLTLLLLSQGANVWGYSLECDVETSLFLKLGFHKRDVIDNWGDLTNHYGDINDIKSLNHYVNNVNPDIVFHLAAQPLVKESYKNPLLTWSTNLIGSINLLESLKICKQDCAVIMITTDKVYENKNWIYGYRENDALGGHDPYSASKAAMEIAISSWRKSFCGPSAHQTNKISIASARAGNVIGGGDWAKDRVIPDAIRSLLLCEPVKIRNPNANRPWQHVIEPLEGYLKLAQNLYLEQLKQGENLKKYAQAFNFGPHISSNRSVKELIEAVLTYWPGNWIDVSNKLDHHEANSLNLISEKAFKDLDWSSKWCFSKTIEKTVKWYKAFEEGKSALNCCLDDINEYRETS